MEVQELRAAFGRFFAVRGRHHEAIVEHDGAKKLIAEIESSSPGDEYYDARVKVLSVGPMAKTRILMSSTQSKYCATVSKS